MSALAARRAAAAAQSSAASSTASSPAPSRGASASAARRSQTAPQRGEVSPEQQLSHRAQTSIGSPSGTSDSPGPSKRARIDRDPPQRHSTGESNRSVDTAVKGKSKAKQTRKRAFSPSAPMESSDDDENGEKEEGGGRSSDEDSAAGTGSGQDEDDMPDEQDQTDGGALDDGVTPYGSPGPWRPRPLDTTTAVSNFTPRRGHNIDLLPAKLLDKCGYEGTGDGLLIALRRNEYIYLAGAYCLKPVRGEISIFGSTRTGDDNDHSLHVFAPISHAMPAIVGVDGRGHIPRKQPLDLLSNLPTTVPKDFIQAYIIVRGLSTGLEGMRGGAIPGFATAWGPERGWMGTIGIQSVPGSIIAPCYPYQQPTSWTRALACLRRGAKYAQKTEDRRDLSVLVKGPKRSGKSSVARAAVNMLLRAGRRSSVAWLECDLGQGEFGCGGVIGLWVLREPIFGPAFTHPRLPYRTHFLGTYTPLTCPDEYLAAIQHLLHVYHTELSEEMYLVINTQGWVKGLGEELLRSIEEMSDATYTFSFYTKEEEHDDDDGDRNGWTRSPGPADDDHDDALSTASEDGVRRGRFRLEQAPVTPLQQRYAAADYRNLSTMSYLHASFNPDPYDRNDRRPTWDFTSPIIAMPPLEVSLSPDGPLRAVYMQGEGAEGIAERDLPLALNGALVALIHDQSDVEASAQSAVYIQGRPLPSLDSVNCLGLALVRAVIPIPQMQNGLVLSAPPSGYKLHLITPLPAHVLAKANAIIRNGAMELPTPAMLDWRSGAGTGGVSDEGLMGVPWGEVPFFGPETAGVGMEKRRVRRNLMRKGM